MELKRDESKTENRSVEPRSAVVSETPAPPVDSKLPTRNCRLQTPRFVIGAPQGRSGKTTVSLAIALGLVRRGLKVQCFKKGPDFIDPSWLREASGKDCFNLDGYMMPKETVWPSSSSSRAFRIASCSLSK